MRKLFKVSILPALLISILHQASLSCTPCPKILNIKETIKKADLVVVGKRTNKKDKKYYEISISQILKGELKGKKVRVNNDYGMCSKIYGLDLDFDAYILFLTKTDMNFAPVKSGCAAKKLPYSGGNVRIESAVSLEKFKETHGL